MVVPEAPQQQQPNRVGRSSTWQTARQTEEPLAQICLDMHADCKT